MALFKVCYLRLPQVRHIIIGGGNISQAARDGSQYRFWRAAVLYTALSRGSCYASKRGGRTSYTAASILNSRNKYHAGHPQTLKVRVRKQANTARLITLVSHPEVRSAKEQTVADSLHSTKELCAARHYEPKYCLSQPNSETHPANSGVTRALCVSQTEYLGLTGFAFSRR